MLFSIAKILREKGFDSLQIQKLTYIIFGFYAAKYDEYLFDDRIEAWKYGPVIPILYKEIKGGGEEVYNAPAIEDKKVLKTINNIINTYGKKDGTWLIDRTHAEDTPWSEVYKKNQNIEIPRKLIKSYYKKILETQRFLNNYRDVFEALART